MRLRLALALAVGLAAPACGQTVATGCAGLATLFRDLTGYDLTLPPAPVPDGWCVAERGMLRAGDLPASAFDRLALSGTETADGVESLSLELGGGRLASRLGDDEGDALLRSVLRLQTFDMTLTLRRSAGRDGLELRGTRVVLSGGTELVLEADLTGGAFTREGLALAALTRLHLDWRNDGRLVRPVMEAAGGRIAERASGTAAVDVARDALREVMAHLPEASLAGETAGELADLALALPLGRGRMVLDFTSASGLGAARLGLLALSDDPTGPEALGRLMDGAVLTVDWQPGLAP